MEDSQHRSEFTLAPAEGLLGMLQRGRGKAYLLTRCKPAEEIWTLLVECITNDPCLDKQCENREDYYAGIVYQTRMPCEPLRRHLRRYDGDQAECDWKTSLTLSTLSCLVERGHAESVNILREYISYGVDWIWALEVLAECYPSDIAHGIDALLCSRYVEDENAPETLQKAIQERWEWFSTHLHSEPDQGVLLPMHEPWKTFSAQNSELARIFETLGFSVAMEMPAALPPENHPDPNGMSVEELFQWVGKITYWKLRDVLVSKVSVDHESLLLENLSHPNKWGVALAFKGLGLLGTAQAYEKVTSFIEGSAHANRFHRAKAFDAFSVMPPELSLTTARQWFDRDEWHLYYAAGCVLANHATVDDVPLLVEALRRPEALGPNDFRSANVLRALARCEGIGLIPEVEDVFCRAQSCFDRYRAAVAMCANAPGVFAKQYAFECLWDCHWDTRRLACEKLDLTVPHALDGLREKADDCFEDEDVRETARQRLADSGFWSD